MDLTFFGLTSDNAPQFRKSILTEVHEVVFHGGGGYIWSEVYNMPIYLRRFTLSKLKEHYTKANESSKPQKKNGQQLVDSSGKVNKQQFKSATSKYK